MTKKVSRVLQTKYTKNFEDTLLQQPAWMPKRVKRVVPPPSELYPVVKTLVDECTVVFGHTSLYKSN
jgi:hypothetical protein